MARMTSSYPDSTCDLLAVVVSCSFKALIFALHLLTMVVVTFMETTRLTTRANESEMKDIMDAWLMGLSRFVEEVNFICIEFLVLLAILPQLSATVCTAKVHVSPVDTYTSVQATLVVLCGDYKRKLAVRVSKQRRKYSPIRRWCT